jgi:hypothetical protein
VKQALFLGSQETEPQLNGVGGRLETCT